MKKTFPTKLLLQLFQATPKELVAVECFLKGQPLPEPQRATQRSAPKQALVEGASHARNGCTQDYAFRWTGRHWKVVWCGARPFHLRNTLGARYLDYLLHKPNEPIRAFDLEVLILPEKGEARGNNSIQPDSDSRALREYRQKLCRLQDERDEARVASRGTEVERLEGQIEALKAALKDTGAADTGERAFDNVRKALRVVLEQLKSEGPEEQAFADHLQNHLSIGFECLYSQPQGRVWG